MPSRKPPPKPAPKATRPPHKPPPAKPPVRKPAPVKSAPAPVKPPAPRVRPARRPAYEPNDKDRLTVKVMVAGGIEQAAIASLLGVAPKTLRKHFRREIDTGADEVAARMMSSVIAAATKGNVNAMKLWLEARVAGFAPRSELTVTDATPLTALSDADIAARIAHLQRTATTARARKRSGVVH
jgi:DNA-binding transcriptional regulator YdaS (Cro superfamily)